jgi:hypothetical protein
MSDAMLGGLNAAHWRYMALSRWENEGGASPHGPPEMWSEPEVPQLNDAELVQLRVRVIALENLVIALLAEASGRQLALAREMAAYIRPRPGFTQHPLTIHAADRLLHIVEAAGRFHGVAEC